MSSFPFNIGQSAIPDISQPFDDYLSLATGGRASQSSSDPFAGLASQGMLGTGMPGESAYVGSLLPNGSGSPFTSDGTLVGLQFPVDTPDPEPFGGNATAQMFDASRAYLTSLVGKLIEQDAIDGQNSDFFTFSGSDMRVMIEVVNPANPVGTKFREFFEITTLSISIYRVKAPVRACGYINPKGFARGTRTIAGTLVLTQFTMDALYRFLYNAALSSTDNSKDSWYRKPDQLPPFNLTLIFEDEYGHQSFRRLLGVDLVNDGTVYSINDLYSEQTISYMAADFTPLMPKGADAVWNGTEFVTSAVSFGDTVRSPMNVLQKDSAAT
jgi:hypothetical protein